MNDVHQPIAGLALLPTPPARPSFWTDLHEQLGQVVDEDDAALEASPRRPPRRWARVAGVAATLSAAEAMSEVTSYEGQRTHIEPDVSVATMTLRVNGEDFEFVAETRFADGRAERFAATFVDQVGYVTEDGQTTASPRRPGEGLNASYGEASAALVVAAISELPPEQLGLFDLEQPDEIDQLTVWVADNHIYRIEIIHCDGATTRTEFFNLNGDITITPPPGPYAEPGD